MYEAFDHPRRQGSYFERRPVLGYGVAIVLYGLAIAWGLSRKPHEPVVEVELEPEIKDLSPASEPPPDDAFEAPPMPKNVPVERVETPRRRPRPKPPTERPTQAPDTSDTQKTVEVSAGARTGDGARGTRRPRSPSKTRQTAAESRPKSKERPKKKRKVRRIADRPAEASPPKPNPGNPVPVYPAAMRERGVTGLVVLKLKIDATGKVRGAQILRVENDASDEEEKKRFDALMKKAVIRAVRHWTYTPAMLDGKPIETGHMVTIPFRLTT